MSQYHLKSTLLQLFIPRQASHHLEAQVKRDSRKTTAEKSDFNLPFLFLERQQVAVNYLDYLPVIGDQLLTRYLVPVAKHTLKRAGQPGDENGYCVMFCGHDLMQSSEKPEFTSNGNTRQ